MFDKHLGSTIVNWSSIGNADFSIKRDNLAGQAYMDWQGQVYGIKKLGNGFIVYGSGGVTYMKVTDRYFGKVEIASVGCKGRNTWCGTDEIHWYLDQFGNLCTINDSGKLELLKGKMHFSKLSDAAVMSFNASEQEIYITDGSYGYRVTISGTNKVGTYSNVYTDSKAYTISKLNPIISGFGLVKEDFYIASPDAISDEYSTYTTGGYTFGIPGYKTIQTIFVNTPLKEYTDVKLYFSEDGITYNESDWMALSTDGLVYYPCTAQYFKLSIRVLSTASSGFVQGISCSIQASDKRSYRVLPKLGGK
jgi:hypothetical protein